MFIVHYCTLLIDVNIVFRVHCMLCNRRFLFRKFGIAYIHVKTTSLLDYCLFSINSSVMFDNMCFFGVHVSLYIESNHLILYGGAGICTPSHFCFTQNRTDSMLLFHG